MATTMYYPGGDSLEDPGEIVSDTTQQYLVFDIQKDDYVWKKVVSENPGEKIYIQFPNPKHNKDVIFVMAGRDKSLFDQHTLEEIKIDHPMYGQFDPVPFSSKMLRVNYDIHIGAIGGLPTAILAFLPALSLRVYRSQVFTFGGEDGIRVLIARCLKPTHAPKNPRIR